MKKRIIPAICAAAAIACGCDKSVNTEDMKGFANLTVDIASMTGTRATGVSDADEGAVSTLEVFIFNAEGTREAHGEVSGKKSVSITCSKGAKTFWAVANVPSLDKTVNSLDEMKAAAVKLADNAAGAFCMGGSVEETVTGSTATVTIPVSRYSTRVVIRKITNRLKNEALQSREFKVRAIYLTNVQGSNSFAMTSYQGDGGLWFNRMKYEPGNTLPLLCDEVGTVVAYGESLSAEHRFYGMPNDVEASEDVNAGSWSARCTRLVVEASIDGTVMYYPITMDKGFERNKSYEINELVITKSGSDDPDKPVVSEDILFTVEVADWGVVLMGEEGTVTI